MRTGYILPTWVQPSSLSQDIQRIGAKYGSTIVLPLKQDKLWLTHGTNLHIPAESLLFLRKIQSVCTADQMQGATVTHTVRRQPSLRILETEEKGSTHSRTFDMYSHNVPLGKQFATHPTKTLKTSKLVLAFPRDGMLQASPNVFCFLPVYKTGFDFLVHADFALVANREVSYSTLRQ